MYVGLPDNPRYNIPNRGKITKNTAKYTKCSQNIQNGHKIYRMAIKYTSIVHYKTLEN
jgi:hypothetical protein